MSDTDDAGYGWHKEMQISLLGKLRQDLKTAMVTRDTDARNTIRQVMAEFPGLTIPITLESGKKTTRPKKPEEISDDDILDIIRKLVKSEKTVLELKKEDSSAYLRMLETYLPRMATAEEIKTWIVAHVDFAEFKSPMQAMGSIMKHFGKQADGKLVKEILGGITPKKA